MSNAVAQARYDRAVEELDRARKLLRTYEDEIFQLGTTLAAVIDYAPRDAPHRKSTLVELIAERDRKADEREEVWRHYLRAMLDQSRAARELEK